MKYLLDSNIIIYHLNNDLIATNFIMKFYSESSISVITYYEILAYGYNFHDFNSVEKFLKIFKIIDIDLNIVRLAIQNLKVKKVKIADNLITATAQINNLTLVTRNVVDFKGLGVNILNIYENN